MAEDLKGYQPKPVISLGDTHTRLWSYKNIPAYVYGPSPTGMGTFNENLPVKDYLHILRIHVLSAYYYPKR